MRARQLSRRPERFFLRHDKSDYDEDDHASLADTASAGSLDEPETRQCSSSSYGPLNVKSSPCDACPFCSDVCEDPLCVFCENQRTSSLATSAVQMTSCSPCRGNLGAGLYTVCQVRRHNHALSCWLVAGDTVYDVTKHLRIHPGGTSSILRKGGGVQDCTNDIKFHSKMGKSLFQKCIIGKLQPCPGDKSNHAATTEWWMFWGR